jgi:parallel beta-helix repeat protein
LLKEGSTGIAEDNDIFNNDLCGIEIQGASKGTFKNNRITKNGETAVAMYGQSSATFNDNDLRNNGAGSWSVMPDCVKGVKTSNNQVDETALSRAKIGDWIEQKVSFGAGAQKREQQARIIVTNKSAEDLTVDMTIRSNGKETKKIQKFMFFERQDFMSDIEKDAEDIVPEPDKGTDSITVGSRTIRAAWTKYTMIFARDDKRFTARFKVWTSPEIPLDNTVRVQGELPNGVKIAVELLGFGDARTPPPAGSIVKSEGPVSTKPSVTSPPATTTKPAEPAVPAGTTVYILKDGKRIVAQKVVDAGDELSIKDELGKFIMIKKSDIEEVKK